LGGNEFFHHLHALRNGTLMTQMERINADPLNTPPYQTRVYHKDPRHPRSNELLPDILVPQLRLSSDELLHHLYALRQIKVDHFHTVALHKGLGAGEGPALAHDHLLDLELYDGTRAHVARHQRGI